MGALLQKLLGAVTGNLGAEAVDYFKQRQQLKNTLELAKLQGKIDAAKAEAAYKVADLQYDDQWELAQIANSGFKDEYVLIILSVPLVLCFIPYTAPWVLAGFGILKACPGWYQGLLVAIFSAVYGIRVWRRQDGKPMASVAAETPK
jgi:hypothetical protein